MNSALMTLCAVLSLSWNCMALMPEGYDFGSPKVKGALQCEIRPLTSIATGGSRLQVFMIVTNTGAFNAELPTLTFPDPGMRVSVFLLPNGATNVVGRRLVIPRAVLTGDATTEQQRTVEPTPPEQWWHPLQRPAHYWISIPPNGAAEFRLIARIDPRTEDGGVATLVPGTYGLQCEIQYFMPSITDATFLKTNRWTSADEIAQAQASGTFLLDMDRLWTGKMDSNIVPITLSGSQQ